MVFPKALQMADYAVFGVQKAFLQLPVRLIINPGKLNQTIMSIIFLLQQTLSKPLLNSSHRLQFSID